MKHTFVENNDGTIWHAGRLAGGLPEDAKRTFELDTDDDDEQMLRDGCRIESDGITYSIIETDEYRNAYARKRRRAYGSIGEQLDMLYWDNINGTNEWQTHINEVKNQYPKPNN